MHVSEARSGMWRGARRQGGWEGIAPGGHWALAKGHHLGTASPEMYSIFVLFINTSG